MALSHSLLPEFDHETATTRKVLERIPTDQFAWKPHDKSMSFGHLATHVATIANWAAVTIHTDVFDMHPPGGEPIKTPDIVNTEGLLAEFDKLVTAAREAIAGASDDHLLKPWTLQAGGKTILTMPRIAVLRTFVLNHLIHHRGQLSVYLRLRDIPVPSIYGPSGDEGGF